MRIHKFCKIGSYCSETDPSFTGGREETKEKFLTIVGSAASIVTIEIAIIANRSFMMVNLRGFLTARY